MPPMPPLRRVAATGAKRKWLGKLACRFVPEK
jgi:hypothetical protein